MTDQRGKLRDELIGFQQEQAEQMVGTRSLGYYELLGHFEFSDFCLGAVGPFQQGFGPKIGVASVVMFGVVVALLVRRLYEKNCWRIATALSNAPIQPAAQQLRVGFHS